MRRSGALHLSKPLILAFKSPSCSFGLALLGLRLCLARLGVGLGFVRLRLPFIEFVLERLLEVFFDAHKLSFRRGETL